MGYGDALIDWVPGDLIDIGTYHEKVIDISDERLLEEYPIGSNFVENVNFCEVVSHFKNEDGRLCIGYRIVGFVFE